MKLKKNKKYTVAKTNWNMVIFEFLLFRTYCHNSSHHISCHLHRQETSEDQTSQGVSDANLLSNGVRKHQTLYIQHIHIPHQKTPCKHIAK